MAAHTHSLHVLASVVQSRSQVGHCDEGVLVLLAPNALYQRQTIKSHTHSLHVLAGVVQCQGQIVHGDEAALALLAQRSLHKGKALAPSSRCFPKLPRIVVPPSRKVKLPQTACIRRGLPEHFLVCLRHAQESATHQEGKQRKNKGGREAREEESAEHLTLPLSPLSSRVPSRCV